MKTNGARASARFNFQIQEAHESSDAPAKRTLKRRERRAPLAPYSSHLGFRLSLTPGFSRVYDGGESGNRFNGFPRGSRTAVETAKLFSTRTDTRLKPGVNERNIRA